MVLSLAVSCISLGGPGKFSDTDLDWGVLEILTTIVLLEVSENVAGVEHGASCFVRFRYPSVYAQFPV